MSERHGSERPATAEGAASGTASAPALRTPLIGDLPALATIHAAAFPETPWGAPQLAQLLAMPGCGGLLAQEGAAGPIAGFLLWRQVLDEAELLTLAVAPARRRAGLGGHLLESLAALLAAAGVRTLHLEVAAGNASALALYRDLGFVVTGRRGKYYQSGQDALLMQRPLTAAPSREDAAK